MSADKAWAKLTAAFPRLLSGARIAKTLRPLKKGEKQPPFICGAFSPDGELIALSGGGRIPSAPAIWVARVPSFETVAALHGHQGVHGLAWDAKTGLLASASNDYCVVLWDVARGDHVFVYGGNDEPIVKGSVAFGDGYLYIGESEAFQGLNASLLRVSLDTGKAEVVLELPRVQNKRLSVNELAVDPATDTWAIATADFDSSAQPALTTGKGNKPGPAKKLTGRVRALALHEGKPLVDLESDEEYGQRIAVAFGPDGTKLVAVEDEVRTPTWTTKLDVPTDYAGTTLLVVSPDGTRLLVAGFGLVALLDMKSGKVVATTKPPAWFKP